ncbi:MAG: hypothetical protein ABIG44_11880 [Planctomycetota bacterium]
MRQERIIVALFIIILPGVILAPAWRLGGLGANEDDVLYYYPSRVFLQETVTAGHWPWLNPWNGLDRPYAADPQSALWYPFTGLFLVLPTLVAYGLLLWIHYSLAIWGMYRLLRVEHLGRRAALFGGLAFAFCGFLLAHRAHFTMQQAAAWAPWIFWGMWRYANGSAAEDRAGIRRLCVVVFLGALQCFAGHVQIAAITALGTLVYILARCHRVEGVIGNRLNLLTVMTTRWLLTWVCVAGLFAIQWLPTLAYVRECTRAQRTYQDFVENSWHPVSAVGWVLPMFYGQRTPNVFGQEYWGPSHQCEQFSYAGILPLLLAVLGLRAGWRQDPRRRAWLIVLVFGLLLALGELGPFCPVLYRLPGSSLFRVPARALLLFNLAVAALAALSLEDLMAGHTPFRVRLRALAQKWSRRPWITTPVIIVIPLLLVLLALPWLPDATRAAALASMCPWKPAVFVPLVITLASLGALYLVARRWWQPNWIWLLMCITALDLSVIGWTIDIPRDARQPTDLLTATDQSWRAPLYESRQRLWVVTDTPGVYSEPMRKCVANTNVLEHIPALTDYGPLQPRAYAERFGFTPWGISRQPAELLAQSQWLRVFNVGWILLCESNLPAPAGCELVQTTESDWRLYRNPAAAGMAFFDNPTQPGSVRYTARGPNTFTTSLDTWPTQARAKPRENWPRLIVSRLALPGWRATADGRELPIESAHGALLSIRVPPGNPLEVHWSYFPPALAPGGVISTLSTLLLLGAWLRSHRTWTMRPGSMWNRWCRR